MWWWLTFAVTGMTVAVAALYFAARRRNDRQYAPRGVDKSMRAESVKAIERALMEDGFVQEQPEAQTLPSDQSELAKRVASVIARMPANRL